MRGTAAALGTGVLWLTASAIRVATNDGSFADARSMTAGQVLAFLKRWAP